MSGESSELEDIQLSSDDEKKIQTCPICFADIKKDELRPLTSCDHKACGDCLTAYLQGILKDAAKYPLRCFETKCETPLDYEDIKVFLSPEEVGTYDKFLVRSAVTADPNLSIVYCPIINCGAMLCLEPAKYSVDSKATCNKCDQDFCFHCCSAWHDDQTCQEFIAQSKRIGGDEKSVANFHQLADKKNWFQCPTCDHMIERTGGCNHMSHFKSQGCTIQDSDATHFCSLCGMTLGGKYHKTEPDGETNHFPEGLFKNCRMVKEKLRLLRKGKLDLDDDEIETLDPQTQAAIAAARAEFDQEARDIAAGRRAAQDDAESKLNDWLTTPFTSPHVDVDEDPHCCNYYKCLLCSCYLHAQTLELLEGEAECPKMLSCLCCHWYALTKFRRQIRNMFGIPGCCCGYCGLVGDCVISTFLPCCAVVQMNKEIKHRANLPLDQLMA